jgi:hypothetical protein
MSQFNISQEKQAELLQTFYIKLLCKNKDKSFTSLTSDRYELLLAVQTFLNNSCLSLVSMSFEIRGVEFTITNKHPERIKNKFSLKIKEDCWLVCDNIE